MRDAKCIKKGPGSIFFHIAWRIVSSVASSVDEADLLFLVGGGLRTRLARVLIWRQSPD